jgi:hypothetical protein
MEVDCEGCAGCCLDWRPLASDPSDHEGRGPYEPLDDTYNLAPVSGDEVRAFLDAGYGDALVPRLFRAESGPQVTVGGVDVAAVDGRLAFLVGLRKVPKPVAPFGTAPRWLPTCTFLDPATLQCRLHDTDRYPETCSTYPGTNLALGVETECERVEAAHGGDRLVDDEPPGDAAPLFGPAALGARVFVHPDPDRVADAVDRLAAGSPTRADRVEFLAVAAASRPGTPDVDEDRYERARERARESRSWVTAALAEWGERAGERGDPAPDPGVAEAVEDDRGAPPTPGWEPP